MIKYRISRLRIGILALSLTVPTAGFLIATANAPETGLVFLSLLLVVVSVGLMTNPWIGLAASAAALLAMLLLQQYVLILPVQAWAGSAAAEMVLFLGAGPAAGWAAQLIERNETRLEHWMAVAEQQAAHESVFHTLKPEWSKVRLEEEAARARAFARPLAVAVLQFRNPSSSDRHQRVAALQALIRVARSATTAPVVVSYIGENRVLMILPERSDEEAGQVASTIQARCETELYFPADGERPGQPVRCFGEVQTSIAGLAAGHASGEALLQAALADLSV